MNQQRHTLTTIIQNIPFLQKTLREKRIRGGEILERYLEDISVYLCWLRSLKASRQKIESALKMKELTDSLNLSESDIKELAADHLLKNRRGR